MTTREQLELRLIKERLGDYAVVDIVKARDELVKRWREAHPAAAQEPPSVAPRPLMRMEDWKPQNPDQADEVWVNDIYNVTLRRREDAVFGHSQGMIQLGISPHDGTARHDWREFQAIKNQLAGEECEAFELYPAESRLLDPSNYYTLWCFPGIKRLKVGINDDRLELDAAVALAPQRAFPLTHDGKY